MQNWKRTWGLRYIASSLEAQGYNVSIIPFNSAQDIETAVRQTLASESRIAGLSMIFTSRGREFCRLAARLREAGFRGHLVAGGPFASFNAELLVTEFSAFDSVALGEGEELMCRLAGNLDNLDRLPALCYRDAGGRARTNTAAGNRTSSTNSAFSVSFSAWRTAPGMVCETSTARTPLRRS